MLKWRVDRNAESFSNPVETEPTALPWALGSKREDFWP